MLHIVSIELVSCPRQNPEPVPTGDKIGLANRFAKYQELEQSVARQLQADGLNPQELGAVANSKYNYIMQLGGQAYMGAHTADGVAIMQTWITALLDATGKCEVNISDYIDELIEVNK